MQYSIVHFIHSVISSYVTRAIVLTLTVLSIGPLPISVGRFPVTLPATLPSPLGLMTRYIALTVFNMSVITTVGTQRW